MGDPASDSWAASEPFDGAVGSSMEELLALAMSQTVGEGQGALDVAPSPSEQDEEAWEGWEAQTGSFSQFSFDTDQSLLDNLLVSLGASIGSSGPFTEGFGASELPLGRPALGDPENPTMEWEIESLLDNIVSNEEVSVSVSTTASASPEMRPVNRSASLPSLDASQVLDMPAAIDEQESYVIVQLRTLPMQPPSTPPIVGHSPEQALAQPLARSATFPGGVTVAQLPGLMTPPLSPASIGPVIGLPPLMPVGSMATPPPIRGQTLNRTASTPVFHIGTIQSTMPQTQLSSYGSPFSFPTPLSRPADLPAPITPGFIRPVRFHNSFVNIPDYSEPPTEGYVFEEMETPESIRRAASAGGGKEGVRVEEYKPIRRSGSGKLISR